MRRLLGHLATYSVLGVLLTTGVGGQAKGGPIDITVTIEDLTTATTTSFTISKGGVYDASDPFDPNTLISNSSFQTDTSAKGILLSGITATSNNPGASSSVLTIGGTAQVVAGVATSSHQFLVTIETSQDFFTTPTGPSATLAESHGFTVTNTTGAAGDSQSFTSWYDPTNALYGTGAGTTSTGVSTLGLPATGGVPVSGSSPTLMAGVSPYVTPYSLTSRIEIQITGNGKSPNARDVFTGSTTLTAIPEPASIVLMMTSMPLPIMLVGLLNRRRRAKV